MKLWCGTERGLCRLRCSESYTLTTSLAIPLCGDFPLVGFYVVLGRLLLEQSFLLLKGARQSLA